MHKLANPSKERPSKILDTPTNKKVKAKMMKDSRNPTEVQRKTEGIKKVRNISFSLRVDVFEERRCKPIRRERLIADKKIERKRIER